MPCLIQSKWGIKPLVNKDLVQDVIKRYGLLFIPTEEKERSQFEDIMAPDCFYIEAQVKAQMSIPVFHDDQRGTAIISAAAMLNAAELTGRRREAMRVAMISFSNFGSSHHAEVDKVTTALQIARKRRPSLIIDGEMLTDKKRRTYFP